MRRYERQAARPRAKRAEGMSEALQYAFKLLSYRDRSEKEMSQKMLLKGFSHAQTQETISFLKEKNFLNDRKLAESLLRLGVEQRHLGKRGLRGYLMKRGIPDDLIQEFLAEEGDNLNAARELAEKKLKQLKGFDDLVVKRRIYGLLSRKGFSYSTVRDVFKALELKEEDR